jgi:hypothetical protein
MMGSTTMTGPNFKQILLIGLFGRKRDNLLALMESLEESISIQSVDTCQKADDLINPLISTLILIDYQHSEEGINKGINTLIKNQPNIHIVLLRSHLAQKCELTNPTISEVIYDDISVGVLHHLLFDVHLS